MTRTPPADEDVIRAARLDSLGVLLTRIANGVRLTADEARLLMDHIDVEVRESTTAREVARGNLRHVKMLVPELEAAQAAIVRVRRLCEMTIASSIRVQAVQQACDTLALLDELKGKS
jgi:hypothetical protein